MGADGKEYTIEDRYVGLSAQECKEIVPEAVFENDKGYYGLNYESIFVLAIKAIQELSARIKVLEDA